MDEPTREEIEQGIRRLAKRHPLRRRCECNPGTFPQQEEIVALLLETFRDKARIRNHSHEAAAWLLGKIPLTPGQKVVVAQCLSAELLPRASVRQHRAFRIGLSGLGKSVLTAYLLGYLLAIYLTTFNYSREVWDFTGPFSIWALVGLLIAGTILLPFTGMIVFPVVAARSSARVKRMQIALARTLGGLCEPCAVNALAQRACDHHGGVRRAAREALFATLPSLTSEHYGTLSAETTPNLCRILEEVCATKPDFAVALILALEKAGDGRAVETLEHRLFLAPVPVLYQAERVLPILRARRQQEEAQSMLLRASSEPTASREQLLRPVIVQPDESPPEQLLRASQSPQE